MGRDRPRVHNNHCASNLQSPLRVPACACANSSQPAPIHLNRMQRRHTFGNRAQVSTTLVYCDGYLTASLLAGRYHGGPRAACAALALQDPQQWKTS
ncbi:conserved hypothetical protein [Xanthomonas citri pv. bilvae]|nr:conserved hypothetical protein [Xanthomonas citri pv. bilvae]